MKLIGRVADWQIRQSSDLSAVYANAGWRPLYYGGWPVQESYPGAWQQNVTEASRPSLLSFSAVFSCVTGIAGDIAKNRIKLVRETDDGIWEEVSDRKSPFLKALGRPNEYQNQIQFVEQWILSKLLWGNTYIALERDNRGGEGQGVVSAMYALDPSKVTPLISESGAVFYELKRDPLAGVEQDQMVVPAEDIIHDRWNTLWHPLIGVSPLYACAASAYLGAKISSDSAQFFDNHAMPGGLLKAPGRITDETAARLKASYYESVGGANVGKLLVLGDNLSFEAMRQTAEQTETVDQLKWAVGDIARAFHYPEYRLGGPMPAYAGNIQAVSMDYYQGCLQVLIESLERCLDNGLMLPAGLGTEVDTENLLRMDTSALYESLDKARGFMETNEQRKKSNLPKTKGGDAVYKQEQEYSLAALAKRDASPDPFATSKGKQAPPPEPAAPAPAKEPARENDAANVGEFLRRRRAA